MLDETIELANDLMDQKLCTYAERQTDNKRKANDASRNNHGHQQQPFKRQNFAKVYNMGSSEKNLYGGSLPKCTKCHFHHNGLCTQKCHKCNKVGHFGHDCKSSGNTNVANAQRDNKAIPKGNVGNAEKKGNASRDSDSNVVTGSGYQQKDRKPSQNDKTEHGMEKTVQNQGQSPKMPKSINLAAAIFVAVSILKALKTEDLSRKLEVNYVKFQFRGGLLVIPGRVLVTPGSVVVTPGASYARAMIEVQADVELKDNIVAAMPKITREGYYTYNIREECPNNPGLGIAKNLKEPSHAPRGVPVRPKKKGVEPTKEVNNLNPFDVLKSVVNGEELGTNGG
ncbi:putative reverse transcriptase domain-containing protein [Tanacetum coccineum]